MSLSFLFLQNLFMLNLNIRNKYKIGIYIYVRRFITTRDPSIPSNLVQLTPYIRARAGIFGATTVNVNL